MIDIDALKRAAGEGPGDEEVVALTRRMLNAVIGELEAGRKAQAAQRADDAMRGLVFGLPPGRRL